MTYRPFTLEGNFAFASGIHEMLIQSHTGTVVVFPAIPPAWKEVEFNQLRTEGAFLVSSRLKDGRVEEVKIHSEKGGSIRLKNPFGDTGFEMTEGEFSIENDEIVILTKPGDSFLLSIKR